MNLSRIIVFLSLLVGLLFAHWVIARDQPNRLDNELRKAQWQRDLSDFQHGLESRHIDLYNKVDVDTFQAALQDILTAQPFPTDWQIALRLMRLTRKIGDGHTAISIRDWDIERYPLKFEKVSGQWRVTEVSKANTELLRSTLISIDGIAVQSIEETLSDVVQFVENRHSQVVRIGTYMRIAEVLHGLGITNFRNTAQFEFLTETGKAISLPLKALSESDFEQLDSIKIERTFPLIAKPRQAEFDFLWFTQIEGTTTTYIHFSGYPSYEDMTKFVEELVVSMTKNQSSDVIIDMRENGGGDLYVGLILAHGLNLVDSIDWLHGVSVLTGANTFSAGASNAALFRELLNARIVGMPTGSNPTGYQDMDEFSLHHSKLRVTYSKRLFRLQEAPTEGVIPDVLVLPKWSDYQQGIDTAITEILMR